jgi:hypothetical protein
MLDGIRPNITRQITPGYQKDAPGDSVALRELAT